MNFIPITDPEDPRIAAYRDIRERDLVGRDGVFIAEGEVVLKLLLSPQSRFRPLSVLVAAHRAERLAPLLSAAAPAPVYAAAQPVLDRIAGFAMHRGILALGAVGPPEAADALLAGLPSPAMVVVALGIANHDNLGGLFRNAAAFGAGAVILDAASTNPLYRKAIRVSVGTVLTVPFARLAADADPVAALTAAGFEPIALSPAGAEDLADFVPPARTAVMFGAEGGGLPAAILGRVRSVRIPMAPGVDSLNVAVAAGIVLHHLAASSAAPKALPRKGEGFWARAEGKGARPYGSSSVSQ